MPRVNDVPKESPQEHELAPGDVVALRKAHPCGGTDWEVTRVGADIGLKCLVCGRVIMLPRHEFRLRLHHLVRPSGK